MNPVAVAIDGYAATLQAFPALAGVPVLDGPATTFLGAEGIAVGASREDVSGDFTLAMEDMGGGDSTRFTLTNLAWCGSGTTTFTTSRLRASMIYDYAAAALAADRTMRGAVSTAWITSGFMHQEQTGQGVLVAIEFRIEGTLF